MPSASVPLDEGAVDGNGHCVVCGAANPHGLHLRFRRSGEGRVDCRWRPSTCWEGFAGIIHGGIVSTVLDEAMSKAIAGMGWAALTCELRVRIRHSVAPGAELAVSGWVVERRRRRILTEASLHDPSGDELAHAWAVFLAPAS